ncbi:MAG: methyltransferase domain-containing protein [Bacteroidetes bacterium]|nr:methyltransferase domain-containing protein [Bacteroidota bacterium]
MLYYESVYEKKLNIHTARIENLDELTLAGENKRENHHYQGASYMILFRIMAWFPEHIKTKPFIDYGCGKGRALFVAEQNGFTHLIGVDIAQELLHDAKQNLLSFRKKNPGSLFQFVFEDATRFQIPADASVFYFFNPFGEVILKQVANSIKESYRSHPRELYIIYVNPKYGHVFDETGYTKEWVLRSFLYREAIIYTLKA